MSQGERQGGGHYRRQAGSAGYASSTHITLTQIRHRSEQMGEWRGPKARAPVATQGWVHMAERLSGTMSTQSLQWAHASRSMLLHVHLARCRCHWMGWLAEASLCGPCAAPRHLAEQSRPARPLWARRFQQRSYASQFQVMLPPYQPVLHPSTHDAWSAAAPPGVGWLADHCSAMPTEDHIGKACKE